MRRTIYLTLGAFVLWISVYFLRDSLIKINASHYIY
jgi:hypothetical protein